MVMVELGREVTRVGRRLEGGSVWVSHCGGGGKKRLELRRVSMCHRVPSWR